MCWCVYARLCVSVCAHKVSSVIIGTEMTMTAISNNKQTLNKEGYKLTSFNKHNNNNIHLISLSLPLSVCAGYVFMVPFAETVITYWWLFYLKCSITAVGDTNTVINMHTETHKYTLHTLHISRVWLKEKATTTFSVLLALPFSLIVAFAFRLKDQTQTIKKKVNEKSFILTFDVFRTIVQNCMFQKTPT